MVRINVPCIVISFLSLNMNNKFSISAVIVTICFMIFVLNIPYFGSLRGLPPGYMLLKSSDGKWSYMSMTEIPERQKYGLSYRRTYANKHTAIYNAIQDYKIEVKEQQAKNRSWLVVEDTCGNNK